MTPQMRIFAGMLVVTVLAAALSGWLGVRLGMRESGEPNLDTLLHRRLELTELQDRKIDALEKTYAVRREVLQREMRAANRDLARAITHEHRYGPDAQRAIGRFHSAMIALQEETVRHVLAMRAVLTSRQAREFDSIVEKSLTDGSP